MFWKNRHRENLEDDSLVARVEKLESAVRELNDGEDEKNAFTIDELAIILDMKVDDSRYSSSDRR